MRQKKGRAKRPKQKQAASLRASGLVDARLLALQNVFEVLSEFAEVQARQYLKQPQFAGLADLSFRHLDK
jgi:hypothetical protein